MAPEPADAAARQRALDPARSFIVQAPAGSGKTGLLTQRFLRLLAVVDAPEQIVAITFTLKAAAEMRRRVLLALRGVEPAPDADGEHDVRTRELAQAARAHAEARGWALEQHPARLRIQTIDAFCRRCSPAPAPSWRSPRTMRLGSTVRQLDARWRA
jgi:ATP-dependent exoDNAse (exonuclease V) beta subunit